jgi:LacI family transcriptional regulator
MSDVIKHMKLPTVDISAARLIRGIPWVETDDEAITEMAINHLLECGLRNLAFFGDPFYNWSKWRRDFFETSVERRGIQPHIYELPRRTQPQVKWYTLREGIRNWIRKLPKPIGIFACYDACGQQLLEICRYYDVAVPEDVAVIGMDNDELLCELATPPMSSVIPNTRKTGFYAATLLDRMMDGEAVEAQKYSVEPIRVHKRVSTDILTVEDPYIAKAVAFIRNHADDNIRVRDVLKIVPLSRRVFEARFKWVLERTPHQEILRVRTNRVRELLLDSDMSLSEIAEALNVENPEYLSVFFKKETGVAPKEYREQVRGHKTRYVHP